MSLPTVISAAADLKALLATISPLSTLYLDLEGNSLSRRGILSLITILLHPQNMVYHIDVQALEGQTFTVASNNGKTLKGIFEDPSIRKSIWDVRDAADALWALYHVGLAGVTDIQLLENATRVGDKKHVHGLAKCVQSDLQLGHMALRRWLRIKNDIMSLTYTGVFAVRPLEDKILQYCTNDVIHLPDLQDIYMKRSHGDWLVKVATASAARVAEARSPGYDALSRTIIRGPWGSGTTPSERNTDALSAYLEKQRDKALAGNVDLSTSYKAFHESLRKRGRMPRAGEMLGCDGMGCCEDYFDDHWFGFHNAVPDWDDTLDKFWNRY